MAASNAAEGAVRAALMLPRTTLPMRANAAVRELAHTERLTTLLYRRQAAARRGAPVFALHDGPPYANGGLHMGHFLNKVLKDIVNRHKLLSGYRVRFMPGWDCHGLPIELKVLNEMADAAKAKGLARPKLSPLEIRRFAAASAAETIVKQRDDFVRWGVLADWRQGLPEAGAAAAGNAQAGMEQTPTYYATMNPAYEAAQLRLFQRLVERGFVHRSLKPVYWSPSSQTALAEAELEYAEAHKSRSAFISFPLLSGSAAAGEAARKALAGFTSLPQLAAASASASASAASAGPILEALVWTTTPWSMPGNVALAVHPEMDYVIASASTASTAGTGQRCFLVAEARLAELQRVLKLAAAAAAAGGGAAADAELPALQILHRLQGQELAGALFAHPLTGQLPAVPELQQEFGSAGGFRAAPVLCGQHVTSDSGTGIVHTAPAHGHDDFAVCGEHNNSSSGKAGTSIPRLPIVCPVDGNGAYTSDVGAALAGLSVLSKGNEVILEMLQGAGRLLVTEDITHRYPYDWRTKKPVLIRATEQWFVRLGGLVDDCKAAIAEPAAEAGAAAGAAGAGVDFYPAVSRNRLLATLGTRTEWCISRQRAWGVPVPVLYDAETGKALMTPESIAHIASVIEAKGGCNAWWTEDAETFLPPAVRAAAAAAGKTYVKGMDTLDVWFDSGVSWTSAWATGEQGEGFPAAPAASESAAGVASSSAPSSAFPSRLGRPADMVLEGSDQHRGWFQSSLLTAVAATGQAPYKAVVTHGFVLDEHMRKMSKSLGNVIAPGDIIYGRGGGAPAAASGAAGGAEAKGSKGAPAGAEADAAGGAAGAGEKGGKKQKQAAAGGKGGKAGAAGGNAAFGTGHGADLLRWWVASSDYSRDVLIGPGVVNTMSEALRKLRITARFLLGNLAGFDPVQATQVEGPDGSGSSNGSKADTTSAGAPQSLLVQAWSAPVAPLLRSKALMSSSLTLLDRAQLHKLHAYAQGVEEAYRSMAFLRAVQLTNAFMASDLSSLYFDFCKDKLYADRDMLAAAAVAVGAASAGSKAAAAALWEPLSSRTRFASGAGAAGRASGDRLLLNDRFACQLVLWETLRCLTRATAPITAFLAEDVFQHSASSLTTQSGKLTLLDARAAPGSPAPSVSATAAAPAAAASAAAGAEAAVPEPLDADVTVFDVSFPSLPAAWHDPEAHRDMEHVMAVRTEANKLLEAARAAKRIGSALEARVLVQVSPTGRLAPLLQRCQAEDTLEDIFLTSAVELLLADPAEPAAALAEAAAAGGAGDAAQFSFAADVQVPLPEEAGALGAAPAAADAAAAAAAPAVAATERVRVAVIRADGGKCTRCWKYRPEVSASPAAVCHRCDAVAVAEVSASPAKACSH